MADGPYGELGEILAGTMIEARDYAEACELVLTNAQLKYNGAIEGREIDRS